MNLHDIRLPQPPEAELLLEYLQQRFRTYDWRLEADRRPAYRFDVGTWHPLNDHDINIYRHEAQAWHDNGRPTYS